MSDLGPFYQKINRGPAFLFLGQAHLGLESGRDPLLSDSLAKYGPVTESALGYRQLFYTSAVADIDSALAWITGRAAQLSVPDWLKTVAQYPWSGVYSSAIDPIWPTAFRNDLRTVSRVFEEGYRPGDPRNRLTLHCTYLFGSVDRPEPAERAPLTYFDFVARRPAALSLGRRLTDDVTPLGTLVIEGYVPDSDWLGIEDLYAVLASFQPDQVHIFSAKQSLTAHPLIRRLVEAHVVVPHEEGLGWVLERGMQAGLIQAGIPKSLESDRTLTLQAAAIPIPRDIWNHVVSSAVPVDDSVMAAPRPISNEARYWEFREFLFETGKQPVWDGFARGFNFVRAVDDILLGEVRRGFDQARGSRLIILHGPSGSGKTVSLGALAYRIARERTHAVIFITRDHARPNYAAIDRFCQWVEDNGALGTLIVWDGMVQLEEYQGLLRSLLNRGRKVSLVGSTYRLYLGGLGVIEMPDRLSVGEADEFERFLETQGVSITERFRSVIRARDTTFLAALYRLLPPTRPQIRSGVSHELEQTETEMLDALRTLVASSGPTAMATALIEAGIIKRTSIDVAHQETQARFGYHDVRELIDLVMVPGRFGLSVPIELLVRAWGRSEFSSISYLLSEFDIVRSDENEVGRVTVSARHPLEAEILVQARLGSPAAEIDIVKKLMRALRPRNPRSIDDPEVGFAVDLIRSVGPQGQEYGRFRLHFADISLELAALRESRGIVNLRLMLQEANLLRESVVQQERSGQLGPDNRSVLEQGRRVLEQARDLAAREGAGITVTAPIETEIASSLGAELRGMISRDDPADELVIKYEQVRKAVAAARRIDPFTFHPIDVLAWTTLAIVATRALSQEELREALSDILDALETVDSDSLDLENFELLQQRRSQVAQVLGDDDLSEDAFNALVRRGSAVGYYFRALSLGGYPRDINPQAPPHEGLESAITYLEQYRTEIKADARCLNLLFDYWWLSHAKHRFLEGERVALPFTESDWQRLLGLVRDLNSLPDSYRRLSLSFLEAVCLFHLGFTAQAFRALAQVEADSSVYVRGRRRVLRSFIVSDENGVPRRYHGNVRRVDNRGRRGEVYVDELVRSITFFPTDFGHPDYKVGDELEEFHIAFNFLGPIADPVGRYHVSA